MFALLCAVVISLLLSDGSSAGIDASDLALLHDVYGWLGCDNRTTTCGGGAAVGCDEMDTLNR